MLHYYRYGLRKGFTFLKNTISPPTGEVSAIQSPDKSPNSENWDIRDLHNCAYIICISVSGLCSS